MSKYLKVLKKIDKEMILKGYVLTGAGDGDEWIYAEDHKKTELYEWATQCDIGALSYKDIKEDRQLDNRISFYLVYGNAIYETISDMGYNTDKASKDADEVADKVAEHFEKLHRAYA
jgi:hypothetical protein